MAETASITGLHKSRIISIVRRSLAYIDERLIDHGERVAYLAECIARQGGGLGIDSDSLLILCLLHDIGAYKTEEIDNLVVFETEDADAHAIYGYVFLKNTTTLGEYADAILYHHADYQKTEARLRPPVSTAAELIYLADRIDILAAAGDPIDWSALTDISGTVMSPELTELFFAAEAEHGIISNIRDGSYFERVSQRLDTLRFSQNEILCYLKMLVYSIDFRSPFTVTHTANTTAISSILSELFDLDDDLRQDITIGAFLHDIGKIAIPYSILEKPGKLTATEMEAMKTHVAKSEEILSGIVSERVCRIAVRHHEKLNGKGYHHGIDEGELTLPERIVAVADIMSALINRRSYKEPFSKEMTLSIIKSMCDAGELCPVVCAAVAEHYDYIIDISNHSDDPVIELYETIKAQDAELRLNF